MVCRTEIREKHFSSRERQLEKPASGAAAAKSKSMVKGERNSRGEKCGMKHDPEKRRESKVKKREGCRSSAPGRNFPGKASRKGTSPSGKENQPTCCAFKKSECPQGNACNCWHPLLSASFIKKEEATNMGISVPSIHTEKAGGEANKRKNSVALAKTLDVTQAEVKNYFAAVPSDFLHGVSAIPLK